MNEPLPLTGERTVPGIWHENYWLRRHEAAYEYLRRHVSGQPLLEVGCGEGYGTALLARDAVLTVGIDYDVTTVAHAAGRYPGPKFLQANLAALPIRSTSFGVVAALQVIEHVWDHPQFVHECMRVLRPDGLLIITTPNRLTFSPGRDEPLNPFHTREFTAGELTDLLARCGAQVLEVLGVHARERLRALDVRHGGSFVDAQLAKPPQEWSPELGRDVTTVRAADFVVTAACRDACLDLVVVARPAR